ncbi:MAG: hypothetical protein ACRCTL_11895 [Pseudomonas sp.]
MADRNDAIANATEEHPLALHAAGRQFCQRNPAPSLAAGPSGRPRAAPAASTLEPSRPTSSADSPPLEHIATAFDKLTLTTEDGQKRIATRHVDPQPIIGSTLPGAQGCAIPIQAGYDPSRLHLYKKR